MKGPFDLLRDHEQVVFGEDRASGLKCIIAIHSTALGPALGGTRMYPYASEEEALIDVLRLSRGMSYKAACAGLDLGGGKGVIIGDPATDKSEALLRAYGRFVESLGGRYVTACDVGTFPADLAMVGRETAWATGADEVLGGSGDSGKLTAYGVYLGMKATARKVWGTDDLAGRHIAVMGLGKVGRRLTEHLRKENAKLTVADVNEEATMIAAAAGATVVSPDEILAVDADILSPNALGNVLNQDTIGSLNVRAICGGANNQLGTDTDAQRLADRGILYAPDYVVNSGGLINVSDELEPGGYNPDRCLKRANQIDDTLTQIFAIAERDGTNTEAAASAFAEDRMASVGRLRTMWLPNR